MRFLLLLTLVTFMACRNAMEVDPIDNINNANGNGETPPANTSMDFSGQKLLLAGSFMNDSHPTSGKAKIYEAKNGKRTLVFENLKSDAGPDLRIYIANDKVITNFTELSNKVENGNKMYDIPTKVDLGKQKFILIWCKQFSVLFGHAELK